MFLLAAVLISLLVPLLVFGLSFTRLRRGVLWALCLMGAVTAWGLVLATRAQLPITTNWMKWQLDVFEPSFTLLLDDISWPFAVALMTLPIATLLTDATRVRELAPQSWAANLALAGLGLMAVVAGDPLTLLMAWAVIDITEIVVLLLRVAGSQERERVVMAFSVRVLGLLFLIVAILQASALGIELTFGMIPPVVSGWLLLTAGLRLGVFPPQQPNLRDPHQRRGLGTLTRLVPVSASLVLLGRVAAVGASGFWLPLLLILAAFSVLWGAVAWVRATDELQGRPFWVLGLGALALAAATLGLPAASQAWGLALLFSGATLFLFSIRQSRLLIFPMMGAVGFSALPLTPAWAGSAVFGAVSWYYQIPLLLGLALLFVGYLRHARAAQSPAADFERWMWLVYPLGLAWLSLTHYGVIYLGWQAAFWDTIFQTPGWWLGVIAIGGAGILLVRGHREPILLPPFLSRFGDALNMGWIYRSFWWLYRSFARLVDVFTRLLEGEGGILWALVMLIMLLVTISLWGTGGGYEF